VELDLARTGSLVDKETKHDRSSTTQIIQRAKVMDAKTLDGVVEMANRKGVTILSDEIYATIAFKKTKKHTGIRTVVVSMFFVTVSRKLSPMTGGVSAHNWPTDLVDSITKLTR